MKSKKVYKLEALSIPGDWRLETGDWKPLAWFVCGFISAYLLVFERHLLCQYFK